MLLINFMGRINHKDDEPYNGTDMQKTSINDSGLSFDLLKSC